MINHTGDIGIEVSGKTLAELFENAGFAFFDIITDASRIKCRVEETLSVLANDREQLLVSWLSELLYLFETKRLMLVPFAFDHFDEHRLDARVRGELFDPEKHKIKTEVKAVTYHGLKIEKKGSVYSTTIIFDI